MIVSLVGLSKIINRLIKVPLDTRIITSSQSSVHEVYMTKGPLVVSLLLLYTCGRIA